MGGKKNNQKNRVPITRAPQKKCNYLIGRNLISNSHMYMQSFSHFSSAFVEEAFLESPESFKRLLSWFCVLFMGPGPH